MARNTRQTNKATTMPSISQTPPQSPPLSPLPNQTMGQYTLSTDRETSVRLMVLPSSASDGRMVLLPNPRSSSSCWFLASPQTGNLFELTRVSAPTQTPRSWLITTDPDSAASVWPAHAAHVSQGAQLFVATPFDPVFLVLPALAGPADTPPTARRLFLSMEDHLDALLNQPAAPPSDLAQVLQWPAVRAVLERRVAEVCDSVPAGDETMYRLSEDKLIRLLVAKARVLIDTPGGLPASMEEQFVKKVLNAPVSTVRRVPASSSQALDVDTAAVDADEAESTESQSFSSSTTIATAATTTAATTPEGEPAAELEVRASMCADAQVLSLQRLRCALSFACDRCLPPALTARIQARLGDASVSPVDFSPLDKYLERVALARAEAAAVARTAGEYARKHSRGDDEAVGQGDEAKPDKKRRVAESKGVRQLKKVDTAGMRKLTDFFGKKK